MPTSSDAALAIRCQNLTKTYQLGEELSLQNSLASLLPGVQRERDRVHALDDVTFEVERGAYFGIVGTNGSGKSTLTQIISGITVPSAGEVTVWGRVLPLLEINAGFHLELTGRENIALLGTVLGLDREEIEEALPRISEFSGVKRHLDTPIKRFSSGMQARLSFGTAVSLPADTYVFDEVLAVVDDDFREQCVAELRSLHARGNTVVFMSHDLHLVQEICTSGMWLEQGVVQRIGPMDEVAAAYTAHGEAATVAS